jgi:hypothetical protein
LHTRHMRPRAQAHANAESASRTYRGFIRVLSGTLANLTRIDQINGSKETATLTRLNARKIESKGAPRWRLGVITVKLVTHDEQTALGAQEPLVLHSIRRCCSLSARSRLHKPYHTPSNLLLSDSPFDGTSSAAWCQRQETLLPPEAHADV